MRLGGGAANDVPSPPPTRAARGRAVGGGVPPRALRLASRRRIHPPPPPPPHRCAEGGEQTAPEEKPHSIPPASAKIQPRSCRRRWARSGARNDRRGPLPTAPIDARAATIRGRRTTGESGPAAVRPAQSERRSGCWAAHAKRYAVAELSSRGARSPRPACGERYRPFGGCP